METQKIYNGINSNTGSEFLNIVVHKRWVYEHYITYHEQTALVDYKTTNSHALSCSASEGTILNETWRIIQEKEL